jgi:hypothetical protein
MRSRMKERSLLLVIDKKAPAALVKDIVEDLVEDHLR